MPDDTQLDKQAVRRSFDRAAATYDASAVLQREVCQRMLARLDYVKVTPRTILDAGSGTGMALPALRQRFGDGRMIALDIAHGMLRRAARRDPWWRRVPWRKAAVSAVCGDIEHLPLAAGCAELVCSNLALQWVNELPRAFGEIRRVLAPGGLLMFTTFGPDTLKELRAAYRDTDNHTHINRFVDMHDIGDMLVRAGFADPVIDMEMFTLTYGDLRELMRDLKSIGAHNVTAGRPAGLTAKSTIARVAQNYETLRRDGRLPATFEIVYGHAWNPAPRTSPAGRPIIDIKPAKRS